MPLMRVGAGRKAGSRSTGKRSSAGNIAAKDAGEIADGASKALSLNEKDPLPTIIVDGGQPTGEEINDS